MPLEEVASALALIGFTEALQAPDVMDNTLSGVVQVRAAAVPCGSIRAYHPGSPDITSRHNGPCRKWVCLASWWCVGVRGLHDLTMSLGR